MARKKVIDLDTYSQLDAWAISLHEMYRALRRAGFAVDLCLSIIQDRDAYPDWILPEIPDRVESIATMGGVVSGSPTLGWQDNEDEVLSDQLQIAQDFISALTNDPTQEWTLSTSVSLTRFVESRDDSTAGWVATLSFAIPYSHSIPVECDASIHAPTQSDYQDIPDGGDITGITGGEFGIVFLEKAIVRMSYIGSPLFFQFDTISRNIGCIEGGSIAQYGGISYFLSDDGFYSCDGQNVVGIGAEKVDRYFFNNANIGDIDTSSAAVDPERNLVIWNHKKEKQAGVLLHLV